MMMHKMTELAVTDRGPLDELQPEHRTQFEQVGTYRNCRSCIRDDKQLQITSVVSAVAVVGSKLAVF